MTAAMSTAVPVDGLKPADDAKLVESLRARFALLGHELHVIAKGGRVHYEVRRFRQCRSCSTLHDVQGFLSSMGDRP